MYCLSFLRFCTFFKIFHIRLEEKRKNVSFYTVYVCVKAKLTFVVFVVGEDCAHKYRATNKYISHHFVAKITCIGSKFSC